jgi:hypothetical protein
VPFDTDYGFLLFANKIMETVACSRLLAAGAAMDLCARLTWVG